MSGITPAEQREFRGARGAADIRLLHGLPIRDLKLISKEAASTGKQRNEYVTGRHGLASSQTRIDFHSELSNGSLVCWEAGEVCSPCFHTTGGAMILNRGEKNALRRFSREKRGYQAVSKWKGIGLPSMRSLLAKGLVAEGPSGIFGPTFKLTTLGLAWRERLTAGK